MKNQIGKIMKKKTILGVVIAVVGIAMILTSFYIKSQVSEGRQQIAEAQGKLNTGKKLFSVNPFTKKIDKEISGSVQGEIDDATRKANFYNSLVLWLQIGGVVFIVLGGGIIYYSRKRT